MYTTLIIVDDPSLIFSSPHLKVISFEQYLHEYPKRNERKTRLINLCDTEHYLSKGYYCSLLAEARQHKALPSVSTINTLRESSHVEILSTEMETLLKLVPNHADTQEYFFYFGYTTNPTLRRFAQRLFNLHPAPILRVVLSNNKNHVQAAIERFAFAQLNTAENELFIEQLNRFTQVVWRSPNAKKRQRWDMAILVNPEEPSPPSDKDAIKRFIKAAEKCGIQAETVTSRALENISQYDALFIRETTAIDHPTYRLARKAEKAGLVVIDDSTSILRCCNKVFLHDAFSYKHVPSPKTHVVANSTEETLNNIEQEFTYPIVIKMPEGSFSKGVYKVSNRTELKEKLIELFSDTALVLIQEYLYTEFDWRIGVLNGRAIYACRYHMARNHWQIYNHSSKRFNSGGFETLPTFEVPKPVLDASLKACAIIGNGLYGVDIKQKGQQVYVIEVNDNPSIDHKVEDLYLGNELYMQIMQEFALRLENRGR